MLSLYIGPDRKSGEYFTDKTLWAFQGLIMLEKELAYLGSVCAAALMKKDLALPIGMETVDEQICWRCFRLPVFLLIHDTSCV